MANFTVVSVIILVLFLLPYTLFYFLYDLSFVGVMSAAPKYGVGSEYLQGCTLWCTLGSVNMRWNM